MFIYYSTYLGVNYIYRTVATWVVLLTFSRVIIDDCTGEINLPLRLRGVRWYTFYAMNEPCGVFVGLWMMYGRDESPPTPAVCSLILAMNKPCGVFVGLWMIVGRDKSAPTPTECSLIYIYAMNKPCGVVVGLWMIVGRDESAPTPTVCSLIYILRNE